jgi:hypothetical protein
MSRLSLIPLKVVVVHEPDTPSPEPSDSAVQSAGYEAVAETLELVLAEYTRRLMDEKRSPAPDPARLEQLTAQRRECVRDRDRLQDASAQEVARIAELYAARWREIEASGP